MDCTASDEIANNYSDWFKKGIRMITPNKKANTSSYKQFDSMKTSLRDSGVHFLYESTVGAGLPIINSLRDLIHTGDQIQRIEGVFSGTLSHIFNKCFSRSEYGAFWMVWLWCIGVCHFIHNFSSLVCLK